MTESRESLQTLADIDRVCDAFESAWMADAQGRIEDYLDRVPLDCQPRLFRELLLIEVQQRIRGGQDLPCRGDLSQRFPALLDEIGSVLSQYDRPRDSMREHSLETPGNLPSVQQATGAGVRGDSSPRGPSPAADLPCSVADYDLLERLGQGGMGVVYRARHRPTNRFVALKLIRGSWQAADDEFHRNLIERFKQEAMAAARVEHDHIVTIYDAGELEDSPFYTMRLVEGEDLAAMVQRGPLKGKTAAAYMRGVSRAVHAAHKQGILHRDLKPHNILVDAASDRALVSDFGLAKLVSDSERTRSGEVFGSPSYMAPEQAIDARSVSAASDVYSLGATLYHLITGRAPFQCASFVETLQQLHELEPVPPRALDASIHKDLETITLKCLEKDPAHRFSSAEKLADELDRYVRDEPIQARRISATRRVVRWSSRNRLLAAACAVAALSLIIGATFVTTFAFQSEISARGWQQESIFARQQADRAEKNRQRAADSLHESLLANAGLLDEQRTYGWSWNALAALTEANRYRPARADLSRLRSLFCTVWIADDLRQVGTVASGLNVAALAFSPDGERLAVGELKDNLAIDVQIYRTASLELERTFSTSVVMNTIFRAIQGVQRAQDGITCLAFSGDGRWLFAGTRQGDLFAWDLQSDDQEQHRWHAFDDSVHQLFPLPSSYGLFANSGRKDGRRLLGYEWKNGEWSQTPLLAETTSAHGVAFSEKHSHGFVALPSGLAHFARDCGEDPESFEPRIAVGDFDLHPSGAIVAGVSEATIRFVDVQCGSELRSLEVPATGNYLRSPTFSFSGDTLVVTGKSPVVHLVDCSSAEELPSLATPGRESPLACFAEGIPQLAVTRLKRVDIYELRTNQVMLRSDLASGLIEDIALSTDGETAFTATRVAHGKRVDCQIDRWDCQTGILLEKYHCFTSADKASKPARIDIDGDRLAVAIAGVGYSVLSVDELHAVDPSQQRPQGLLELAHQDKSLAPMPIHVRGKGFDVDALAFGAPHDACTAVIGSDLLVNWETGRSETLDSWDSKASAVITGMSELTALASFGELVVIGRRDGWCLVNRTRELDKPELHRIAQAGVSSVAINASHCVLGTRSGELQVREQRTMNVEQEIEAFATAVTGIAITDNGDLVVGSSETGELCMWHRRDDGSYDEVLRVDLRRPIVKLCVDAAGETMLVQLQDTFTVQLWNLRQLKAQLEEIGLAVDLHNRVSR